MLCNVIKKKEKKKILYLSKMMSVKNFYVIILKSLFIYKNIMCKYHILNKYKWLKYQPSIYKITRFNREYNQLN